MTWNSKSGVVEGVFYQGRFEGVYSEVAGRRIVDLTSPLKFYYPNTYEDSCGVLVGVEYTTSRYAFALKSGNTKSGTSTITYDEVAKLVGGCDDGKIVFTSSIDDESDPVNHLSMSARASMSDIKPGVQIAGFSEQDRVDLNQFVRLFQDVVKLEADGTVIFDQSATVVPAFIDSNGWLQLRFKDFQRGYTRLKVDKLTGAETWLMGDFVDGKPNWVVEALITKFARGGSFGTVAQASRVWSSGTFADSRTPFIIRFFRDGTGERQLNLLDFDDVEVRPIEYWRFEGRNILHTWRTYDLNPKFRIRTWEPIGNKEEIRWIMESEVERDSSGVEVGTILRRLNFYIDEGRAQPSPKPSSSRRAVRPELTPGQLTP